MSFEVQQTDNQKLRYQNACKVKSNIALQKEIHIKKYIKILPVL